MALFCVQPIWPTELVMSLELGAQKPVESGGCTWDEQACALNVNVCLTEKQTAGGPSTTMEVTTGCTAIWIGVLVTPAAEAVIAYADGEAAGFALFFQNFSTFEGKPGLYLEDLFVRPAFRRRGLARALLRELARECVAAGYTRLTWAVLDWNVNAIALYDAVGGRPQTEWITYRVSGPELSALAGS